MSEQILANMIRNRMDRYPDLDVLTFVDVKDSGELGEEIRRYSDLWNNGQCIARGFDEEGLRPGQTVALMMNNHPEFVEAMVACSIHGSVFVPVDARTTGDRLVHQLGFAECQGALVADYALQGLVAVLDKLATLKWIWVIRSGSASDLPVGIRSRWIDEVLSQQASDLEVRSRDPDAPMQMLYTSGTTGDPKAILSPHSRFATVASLGETIGFHPDDRPYTGLSLVHSNAQFLTMGTSLWYGLRGVISRKFTRSRLWDIVRSYQCTTFCLLGGMTTALLAEPPAESDRDNPVQQVLSAGMSSAVWESFRKRFDVEIFEFYGTAEGGMLLNPPGSGPVGSVGKPPDTLIAAILDDNDLECPAGVNGEICFRNTDGSAPPVAYFRNPGASRKKVSGGWFRSGDVGHTDSDGWFYFDYRKGDAIRRNGEFVDPRHLEKVLLAIDFIRDVHVYGLTTDQSAPGERVVVAALEVEEGFSADLVFHHCQKHLSVNLIPGYLQVVDIIPKTPSEKPQSRILEGWFDPAAANVFAFSA